MQYSFVGPTHRGHPGDDGDGTGTDGVLGEGARKELHGTFIMNPKRSSRASLLRTVFRDSLAPDADGTATALENRSRLR